MDHKELAKKIREAIFNRIEEDKCIHASSIEQEVEKVLGAMSIGHQAARGASAPIPTVTPCVGSHRWLEQLVPPGVKPGPRRCGDCGEAESASVPKTHTLTAADIPSHSSIPTIPNGTRYNNGQHTFVWLGDRWANLSYSWDMFSGVAEALSVSAEAQVEIIIHPEAADK